MCLCDIPRQKCPGNLVLTILEYTGIYWNLISLLLYEPCHDVLGNAISSVLFYISSHLPASTDRVERKVKMGV